MNFGARNKITATVSSIKSDSVMSLVKFEVNSPCRMASVLTTESLEELNLKPGDQVELIIKAVNVLPVKP
jgi:molybdopterin-binding protein